MMGVASESEFHRLRSCIGGIQSPLLDYGNIYALKVKFMRTYITLNSKTYLQLLLLVPAVALQGFASCSTTDGAERLGELRTSHGVTIGPRAYNPYTQSFEKPWPFGPEST